KRKTERSPLAASGFPLFLIHICNVIQLPLKVLFASSGAALPRSACFPFPSVAPISLFTFPFFSYYGILMGVMFPNGGTIPIIKERPNP
ncbi:MAG: hypothetical protein Q4G52_12785, partial [Clostridia bacterium]|nr:hypothetical protein [Clostridia bacterium]